MSRNGDIRGFFTRQPAGLTSTKATNRARDAGTERAHAPLSQLSSDIPSSPVTPQRKSSKALSHRATEIKGSDEDDDDDSDSSLESLSALWGRKNQELSGGQDVSAVVMSSSKTKRFASSSGIGGSQTRIQSQQQKHRFDLKSLVSHARQDHATEQSAKRADELLRPSSTSKGTGEVLDSTKVRETAKALLDQDSEDSKGDKLVMAMDRTQANEASLWCYFFSPNSTCDSPTRRPFPTRAVRLKPWSILKSEKQREQMFIRGLPTVLAQKEGTLPDELYQWILDEICVEKKQQLRTQYINIATLCEDNTRRQVDEKQLYHMLELMGGSEHEVSGEKFTLSSGMKEPYLDRDWVPLGYFLQLLGQMAPNLAIQSAISATKLLLRLSLDPVVTDNVRIRLEYSKAIQALVSALPSESQQWNYCCGEISQYIYRGVDQASQRCIAISLIPSATGRLVELQRRLASVALLDNASAGAIHPDQSVEMHDLFVRLAQPDFQVNQSTDFTELNALITLLDIVIGNGWHLQLAFGSLDQTPNGTGKVPRSANQDHTSLETDTKFDAEVDRLARGLKALHDKINDNALISRKEAKAALDGMGKRLAYTVRTKPPPKSTIFDTGLVKEDVNLPKQRHFMQNWAKRRVEKKDQT
ncbi:hypothetical protein BX600DRAFT_437444 [Xylariales sp. PMI_506]|nr:hypothetical protein BX600DRAFT_437444 [Xylariales sp. PMI_506]